MSDMQDEILDSMTHMADVGEKSPVEEVSSDAEEKGRKKKKGSTESKKQDRKSDEKVRVFNKSNNTIQLSINRHKAYWFYARTEVQVDKEDLNDPRFKAYASELIIRQ